MCLLGELELAIGHPAEGPSPARTPEATCQAPEGGPQGHLSPSLGIIPGSAPPSHWCSGSRKGSACPYREGRGLVGEGAASEGGGLADTRGVERAELRTRVCKLLEMVPKGGTGKSPKPASTRPPKTSPYASQPPVSPSTRSPTWSPRRSATRFCVRHVACPSLQPGVLVLPCWGSSRPSRPVWQLG